METKNNNQYSRRSFIDVLENMLEVMPGDIILRPRPRTRTEE